MDHLPDKKVLKTQYNSKIYILIQVKVIPRNAEGSLWNGSPSEAVCMKSYRALSESSPFPRNWDTPTPGPAVSEGKKAGLQPRQFQGNKAPALHIR